MIARNPELRLKYDDRAKEEKDRFSMLKDERAAGRLEGEALGEARGEAKGEARGKLIGRAEGESRGKLIGQVQAYERVLGLAVSDESRLSEMELAALSNLVSDLEQQIGKRG